MKCFWYLGPSQHSESLGHYKMGARTWIWKAGSVTYFLSIFQQPASQSLSFISKMGTVTLPRAVSLGASRSSRTGFERKEFPWKVLLDTLLGVEKWTGRQWEAAACEQTRLVCMRSVHSAHQTPHRRGKEAGLLPPSPLCHWLGAVSERLNTRVLHVGWMCSSSQGGKSREFQVLEVRVCGVEESECGYGQTTNSHTTSWGCYHHWIKYVKFSEQCLARGNCFLRWHSHQRSPNHFSLKNIQRACDYS